MSIILDNLGSTVDLHGLKHLCKGMCKDGDERHEVTNSFCNGKCRTNPTLIDIKTDKELEKQIVDNRQRLNTVGRNIQSIQVKNNQSDVGENEAETNRIKLREYNQELSKYVQDLHWNRVWQATKRNTSKELWRRQPTNDEANIEFANSWEIACSEMTNKFGGHWFFENKAAQREFRERIAEMQGGKSYLIQLTEVTQRRTDKKEMLLEMATAPHTTLPMSEANERMRFVLDELEITELHERGFNTEYTYLREPLTMMHPYPDGLKHHHNRHGKSGSEEYTTGREYHNKGPKAIDAHEALDEEEIEEIFTVQTQRSDYEESRRGQRKRDEELRKAHTENEKLKEDNRKEVYLRKKKRLSGGGQGIAHDDEYYTTRNQHTVEVYNAFKEVMEEPYYWLYERGKELRNKKMETGCHH